MGKTIGIFSIKGGVGKTSSTLALGDAISSFGKKVLLVDANFSSPNLGIYLKIVEPEKTLHDVMSRKANFKETIHKSEIPENYEEFRNSETKNFRNFDVLPATIFPKYRINPFDLKKKLGTIKRQYDFIIIDSSPALNEETLAAMTASDEIIIVTTPDHVTLSTTLKAIKLAKQRDTKINGIILNKVQNKNFELSIEDIENTVDVPVLASIPYDINVLKSASKFLPLTSHKPRSHASKEYRKLASVLTGEKYKSPVLKRLFKITPNKPEINREVFYNRYFE